MSTAPSESDLLCVKKNFILLTKPLSYFSENKFSQQIKHFLLYKEYKPLLIANTVYPAKILKEIKT